MRDRLSRRSLVTGGGAIAANWLAARRAGAQGSSEQRVLRILGWPAYFADAITEPFRLAHDVRIEVTGIATPDDTMLFLRAGGVGLYDIVAPAMGLVDPLGSAGLLAELDLAAVPNAAGLLAPFQDLPASPAGRRFGIPLLWGSFGLTCVADMVAEAPAAWIDLRQDLYTDRLAMPDDGMTHFWIWNWALGADDPTRVSREWLENTANVLIELKQKRAVSFGGSAFDTMMRVANGEAAYSTVGWQSAPLLTRADQLALATTRPAPGGASFCDCIAVVADSHEPDLARQFVDFMLAAETQRSLIDRTRWATVCDAAVALLDPAVAALYDYAALDTWLGASPIRGYPPVTDDGSGAATYLDWVIQWDRVRQARL